MANHIKQKIMLLTEENKTGKLILATHILIYKHACFIKVRSSLEHMVCLFGYPKTLFLFRIGFLKILIFSFKESASSLW